MSSNWRDLRIDEQSGAASMTLGKRLDQLRQQADSGDRAEAFEQAVMLSHHLHDAGLDREALELLDQLVTFVGQDDLDPEAWPWLLNARGMALSGLERYEQAESEYIQMQALGQALSAGPAATDLISTALQNQGIAAVESGESERAVALLREALALKLELEDVVSATDILSSLALAVADQGALEEAEQMLASALDLSQRIGDERRLSAALGNRGLLRTRRGDLIAAEQDFRAVLRHTRKQEDPLRELQSVLNIGSSLAEQGRLGLALRWYRKGARLAAESGAIGMEVKLRRSVALMLLRSDRDTEAVAELERALALSRQLGHERYAAECLADLGALKVRLGEREPAQRDLEAAREAFVAIGDPSWRARVTRNLAEIAVRRKDLEGAETLWRQAEELLAEQPQAGADLARRAAEAWVEQGDMERSEDWLGIELERAGESEAGPALAWRTATAGVLLNRDRASEPGLALLSQALERYEEIEDGRGASQVRIERARALSDLGRHEEAIADLQWCLALAVEHSDRAQRQHALANLGEVARRNGDFEQARAWLEEAVELAERLGDEEALAHALGILGLTRARSGEEEAAVEAFSRQLELAQGLQLAASEASALGGLANFDFKAGRYGQAASRYRRAAELNAGIFVVGEIESLGGLLNSLASAGELDQLQAVVQRVIDVGQSTGWEDKAADELASAARVLLRGGEQEGAADLYGAAIKVRLSASRDAEDAEQELLESAAMALGLMVAHVEVDLAESERQAFLDAVIASLDANGGEMGTLLRPYLEMVRKELGSAGMFDRLRQEEQ